MKRIIKLFGIHELIFGAIVQRTILKGSDNSMLRATTSTTFCDGMINFERISYGNILWTSQYVVQNENHPEIASYILMLLINYVLSFASIMRR